MYQRLVIFAEKESAAKRAAALGYDREVDRHCIVKGDLFTECECGETGVVVFENALGDEVAFGICESCGE